MKPIVRDAEIHRADGTIELTPLEWQATTRMWRSLNGVTLRDGDQLVPPAPPECLVEHDAQGRAVRKTMHMARMVAVSSGATSPYCAGSTSPRAMDARVENWTIYWDQVTCDACLAKRTPEQESSDGA